MATNKPQTFMDTIKGYANFYAQPTKIFMILDFLAKYLMITTATMATKTDKSNKGYLKSCPSISNSYNNNYNISYR